VGVGAAAGGLEAFLEMLRALPERTGMAFVFVQRDVTQISASAEFLKRETRLRIVEAGRGLRIEPDRVYIVPRRSFISIRDGAFVFGRRATGGGEQNIVDAFFRALASDAGPRAIGVVLSGDACDGALGLKAIKAAGGVAIAQDPATSNFEAMPQSAIATGYVDFVLRPQEIAAELMRLCLHPYVKAAADSPADVAVVPENALARILALVREATGVDFSQYKLNVVKRRILRRAMLRRADRLEKYLETLQNDRSEAYALYEDILINVTEFFRDPAVFDALKTIVFPRITQQRKEGRREIRVWVPGCSTGEEVYSIAIAILEHLGDRAGEHSIQIFGTDLSEAALATARSGAYPASIAQNVSAERLRRFFTKVENGYEIHQRIRELCVFARHDLAKDPPFPRLDLISCRNVLIYLNTALQERIIPTFHYALKRTGFLLLGSSETVSAHRDLFALIHKRYKIYAPAPALTQSAVHFTADAAHGKAGQAARSSERGTGADFEREAERMILSRCGSPGVLIDESMNVLQLRGPTGAFLAPASRAASLNLGRMLRQGLSAKVKSAVIQARRENCAVRREGLRVRGNPRRLVNVEVTPLVRKAAGQRRFLVVFESVEQAAERRVAALEHANERLRHQLAETRRCLLSAIEDQQTAHEELRCAAEEIQCSNEELRSVRKKFETARAELQSTNEGLRTANEELRRRNMQLTQIGHDLLNLLNNVNIPVLILGNDLRIRRFTPVAETALGLIPSDVGRPIGDIHLRIQVPNLEGLLGSVLETLVPQTVEAVDQEGRRYSLRARPYRTENNKVDGIVIVIVEIEPGTGRPAGGGEAEGVDHPSWPGGGPGAAFRRGAGSSLLLAQEEERRRLSHELHDELNQRLALLEVSMQQLERRPPEELRGGLEQLRKEIAGLSDDLRRIAYQLHPSIVEDLGLVAAVRNYCEEFTRREGIQTRFTHRNIPAALPAPLALGLYRIVQEGLRNAAKHSGAKRAWVALTGGKSEITLSVRDFGSGFDPAMARLKGGLGVTGMQERLAVLGGKFQISSAPGRGTELRATVPLHGGVESRAE
jgi:two-component system CheB/CheR fusion protein